MPEEEENMLTDSGLIAWRLGKLEQAISQTNIELRSISELSASISKNTWRIESLETSRTRMYAFLASLTVAIIVMALQLILRLV